MNPLTVNPLAVLGGAVLVAAVGFGAGWQTNGWRLNGELAEQAKNVAESRATSANAALDQLAVRIDGMNTAAAGAQVDVRKLNAKLDQVRKDLKNAQAHPLAAGCAPDAARMQSLREAVGAANAAVQGADAR